MAHASRNTSLCTREVQKSIRDSVHKLLGDQVQALGLGGLRRQQAVIKGANGTEFLFSAPFRPNG